LGKELFRSSGPATIRSRQQSELHGSQLRCPINGKFLRVALPETLKYGKTQLSEN